MRLFRFLAERWVPDPANQKELKEIHAEVEKLRAKRNQLAQAVWGRNPAKPADLLMFYLPDIEKHILPKAQRPTLVEVKRWAADLDKLNVRLERFHKRIGAPKP